MTRNTAFVAAILLWHGCYSQPTPGTNLVALPPNFQSYNYLSSHSTDYYTGGITVSNGNWKPYNPQVPSMGGGWKMLNGNANGDIYTKTGLTSSSSAIRVEAIIQAQWNSNGVLMGFFLGNCDPTWNSPNTVTSTCITTSGYQTVKAASFWQVYPAGDVYGRWDPTSATSYKNPLTSGGNAATGSSGCKNIISGASSPVTYKLFAQVADDIFTVSMSPMSSPSTVYHCFGFSAPGIGNILANSGVGGIDVLAFCGGEITVKQVLTWQLVRTSSNAVTPPADGNWGTTMTPTPAPTTTTTTTPSTSKTTTTTRTTTTTSTSTPSTSTTKTTTTTPSTSTSTTTTSTTTMPPTTSSSTSTTTKSTTTSTASTTTSTTPSTSYSTNLWTTQTTGPSTSLPAFVPQETTYDTSPAYATMTIQNGFPAIPLIEGNRVPSITMDDLLQCPSIKPWNKAPDYGTDVYITFSVERLIGLEDSKRIVNVWASVLMQWKVTTCAARVAAPNCWVEERLSGDQHTAIWKPKYLFTNSSTDVYLESDRFAESVQVMYQPTYPNRTIYFSWNRMGIYDARCDYDLRSFPWDSQVCHFTFILMESTKFNRFAGAFMHLGLESLGRNTRWKLISSSRKLGTTFSPMKRSSLSSYTTVRLEFSRIPKYYLTNLLAPCFVLLVLVYASFIFPVSVDRAAFSATILLSIMVTLTLSLDEIPRTSQRVLFCDYIQLIMGICAFVTIYHSALCAVPQKLGEIKRRLFGRLHMSSIGCLDLAGFLLSFSMFGFINVYALAMMD